MRAGRFRDQPVVGRAVEDQAERVFRRDAKPTAARPAANSGMLAGSGMAAREYVPLLLAELNTQLGAQALVVTFAVHWNVLVKILRLLAMNVMEVGRLLIVELAAELPCTPAGNPAKMPLVTVNVSMPDKAMVNGVVDPPIVVASNVLVPITLRAPSKNLI